jgi:hypothetical protein
MKTPSKLSGKRSVQQAALDATSRALRGWASGPWKDIARTEPGATVVASDTQTQSAAVDAWEDEGGATVVPIATKFGARLIATQHRALRPR